MLLMGNLPKITRRDPFLNQDSFVPAAHGHCVTHGENSKCCIVKTNKATGPKRGKRIYFLVIFYLVWIKNSESFATLILEVHDVKWKSPIYVAGLSLSTFFVHRYAGFEDMLCDLKVPIKWCAYPAFILTQWNFCTMLEWSLKLVKTCKDNKWR